MDNIINVSSDREKDIRYNIKKINHTITELQKLEADKHMERSREYQGLFHISNDDFQHSIEYYKLRLKLLAIDAVIKDIPNLIKCEENFLREQTEYLEDVLQNKKQKLNDDIIPALGADNIIF